MSPYGTFQTWPRWPTMSAVGGTAEVVAQLVAIIEGWLDSLVASPKILRTQMMIVNEGPLLAQSGRSCASSINGRSWNFSPQPTAPKLFFGQSKSRDRNFIAAKERLGSQISGCCWGSA